MWSGYFDDSGTHAASRVVVMAGVLGNERQWKRFESAWGAKLKKPLDGKPSLKSFHLTDCRAGQGAFADYSLAERDAVTHDFRSIMIATKLARARKESPASPP
jgi:hypothetical protein